MVAEAPGLARTDRPRPSWRVELRIRAAVISSSPWSSAIMRAWRPTAMICSGESGIAVISRSAAVAPRTGSHSARVR